MRHFWLLFLAGCIWVDPEESSRAIEAERARRIEDNIAKLTHPTLAVREAAFTQLLREERDVREPLMRAAIYGEADRATAAMQVLEARREPGLAREFVRRWEKNLNRAETADLLARLGDPKIAEELAHFLDVEPRALVRARICRALGVLGGGDEALERAALDPVALVSIEAIRSLESVGGLLAAWRLHRDVERRVAVAQRLGRLRARAAIPELRAGLNDESPDIREACAAALERLQ